MPRSLRIEYPGAIYHVMNRGDRREPIFRDDVDHEKFLTTLAEACAKTEESNLLSFIGLLNLEPCDKINWNSDMKPAVNQP